MMTGMRFRLLAALLVLATPALAQTMATLIPTASQRQTIRLDGPWHYLVDPYRAGWDDSSAAQPEPKKNGYNSDARPDPHGPVVEYEWDKEPVLQVPGDWNTQRPELLFYEGLLWYQHRFQFHPRAGMRTFLHFGAANYRADIAVNGANICRHEGGFTSFDCEVTDALKDGENTVVAAVDNVRTADRVPMNKTDWYNYGGLTGEVSLVEVPQRFLDEDGLALERGAGDRITGFAHVVDAAAGTPVRLRIPELGIAATAATDAQGRAIFSVEPKKLERWSPEHPRLYGVEWQVGGDLVRDEVGFRTIEVRGTEILLNGRPIYLRGISMHAEAPRSYPGEPDSKTGRAATDADARLMLGRAKALGCNFVRMAHYPYPVSYAEEADRLGLLLWEEIPVYWAIHWQNPDTFQAAKGQLDEMIRRDRNRASIAMWSMSNETPISADRTEFIGRLTAEARKDDPTRLITSAMLTPMQKAGDGHLVATLDDPLGKYLDVLGQNEYIGWYTAKSDDAPSVEWKDPLGKPVIVSEFGGDARAGRHGTADDRWTEEYQAHLFEQQLQMIVKVPFIDGLTPWVLVDFRSPTRQAPGIQDGYNRKGLLSPEGEKKLAYEVLHKRYEALAAEGK